jgi:hypothetical protein
LNPATQGLVPLLIGQRNTYHLQYGTLDGLSGGILSWGLHKVGVDPHINKSNGWYKFGNARGMVAGIAIDGYGLISGGAKVLQAVRLARAARMARAAEAARGSEELTMLYRAVDKTELKDILGTGVYRAPEGTVEGKYFFPTKAQAERFIAMSKGRGPMCITSGCFPTSALKGVDTIHPVSEGTAYFIPTKLLPLFNKVIVHAQ